MILLKELVFLTVDAIEMAKKSLSVTARVAKSKKYFSENMDLIHWVYY